MYLFQRHHIPDALRVSQYATSVALYADVCDTVSDRLTHLPHVHAGQVVGHFVVFMAMYI